MITNDNNIESNRIAIQVMKKYFEDNLRKGNQAEFSAEAYVHLFPINNR